MRPSGEVTRRSLLGLALLAAAGCHKGGRRPSPHPAADSRALAVAATREREIVAAYDASIGNATAAARPALQVARALHATHLAALNDAGGVATTASTAKIRNLPKALTRSATDLRRLAVTAVSGPHAALFASIAGSHEVSAVD